MAASLGVDEPFGVGKTFGVEDGAAGEGAATVGRGSGRTAPPASGVPAVLSGAVQDDRATQLASAIISCRAPSRCVRAGILFDMIKVDVD